MKKVWLGFLSLVLVAAFAGCSGGGSTGGEAGAGASGDDRAAREEAREAAGSATTAEAPAEAAPAEAPAEAAPAEAAPAEAPAEAAAPAMDGLVGTKWTHNGIELEFKEGNKVFLKGGPLAAVAPDGTEATYTLVDGKIDVEVMGQVYSGTWDGAKLVVADVEATKVQ